MPDGGYLQIQAENLTLDEKSALRPDGAPPGPYVLVTVSDTGSGIPPEALEKIWEPFFTLKPHGKGSGIGLSTVREIVRSHSGFVGVTTEQGKGTRFRIFLPVAEHVTASLLTEPPEALPVGEGETILVIDDERAFQEITKAIFNRHGYRVITASDGTEAVAAFTNVTKKIHLVVTDMVMPYLDGPSTIRALRRLDPQLPIIATSGLSEGEQIASQIPDVRFLLKPFTTETLLTTVHQSLRPNQKAP
jgi:CheY-like chemotaxis protein